MIVTVRDVGTDGLVGVLSLGQEVNGQIRELHKWMQLKVQPAPRVKIGPVSVGIPDRLWGKVADRVLAAEIDDNFDRVLIR